MKLFFNRNLFKVVLLALMFVIAVTVSFISLFQSVRYVQKIHSLSGEIHALKIQNAVIDTQLVYDYKRQNNDQLQQDWRVFARTWDVFSKNITRDFEKRSDIVEHMEALRSTIDNKYQLILHYESDKAVLANSVFFLLDAEEEMRGKGIGGNQEKIGYILSQLLKNQLYFHSESSGIEDQIALVTGLLAQETQGDEDKELLLIHLRMLSEMNQNVASVLEQIHQLHLAEKLEVMEKVLDRITEQERDNRMVFNSVLAVLALVMLIGFVITFYKTYRKNIQIMALQKENDRKNRELTEKMQLLNEYKRALDESSIVSKTDLKGKITYVNERFCSISGYRPEELLGHPHNIIRHPEFPAEVFQQLWTTIRKKEVFHGIIRNRNKAGEEYYVDSTVVPILDENGNVIEYIAIRNEVTELIRAKNEAIDAGKAKSTFLANMSHELRTPLNAIIGFSQILMAKSDTPEGVVRYIEKINVAGKSLLSLVNTILDFSKIEAGKMTFKPEMVSVSSLLHEVSMIIEPMAQKKSLHYSYPELISLGLYLDRQLIQQVLLNLLSNAVKFTSEGGSVEIEIDYDATRRAYRFGICDSGIGIEAGDLATLFDPFTQVENPFQKTTKGTGLGLAIAKRIIEDLHGGSIWVESTPGEGTRFYFTIPVAQAQTHVERSNSAMEGAGKLLIVEDTPEFQKILLERLGTQYNICMTNSVNRAKEILENERFDFIVLDFFLVDGISSEVIQFMNNNRLEIPTIIISAEDDGKLIANLPESEWVDGIFNKSDTETICDYLTKRMNNEPKKEH